MVTPEQKRQIIQLEIDALEQAEWQLSLRHKVNKKLGATPDELKPIEDQLVKITSQIEVYNEEQEKINEKPA